MAAATLGDIVDVKVVQHSTVVLGLFSRSACQAR